MSEVVREKTLTPRALIIGVLFSVALVFYLEWGEFVGVQTLVRAIPYEAWWPGGALYNVWWEGGNAVRNVFVPAIFLLFVPVVINRMVPKKLRLSGAEITLIFSMILPVLMISPTNLGIGQTFSYFYSVMGSPTIKPEAVQYLSTLYSPQDVSVLQPLGTGGVPVPWSAWTATLAWWIVLYLSIFFFSIFGAALLRRTWVDVESLPFPLAKITTEIIDVGENRKPMILWVGVLISFVLQFIASIDTFYPPIPSQKMFSLDFTPYAITTAALGLTFAPWTIGFGLIVPTEVSFTCSMTFIVMWILLPPLFVAAGQLAPLPSGYISWPIWNWWIGAFQQTPYTIFRQGYLPFFVGIIFGMAVWPLIARRRDIIQTIKLALKSKGGTAEERDEAMPYRYLWIGWGISGLIFIIMEAIINIPIHQGILILAFVGLLWLATARATAESGLWLGSTVEGVTWRFHVWVGMFSQAIGLSDPAYAYQGEGVLFPLAVQHSGMGGNGGAGNTNPMPWSLESYKVGVSTKAQNRGLFIAQAVGVTLATIISLPLTLWLAYTYGTFGRPLGNKTGPLAGAYNLIRGTYTGAPAALMPNAVTYVMLVVGISTVVVISIVRARRGGFFRYLSAAGIWLASTAGLSVWFPFLIAFIVNRLTMRIGGVELYNRKVLPLAIGLLLGYALVWFPATIALILRGLGFRWW